MFSFVYSDRIPPGGKFYYLVPETDVFIESYQSKAALETLVRQHYAVNKREPPANLMALMEDYMCRSMPEGTCKGSDDGRPVTTRPLTFFKVVEKLEVFFRGRPALITTEEAEKRSAICFSCDQNWPGMCVSCNGLKQLAFRMARGRKVVKEAWMGVCRKVGMPLNAALFVKDPSAFGNLEAYPQHCWVRKGTK